MSEMFVGITLGPTSFYDEGIEHVLDLLQEHAAVNAVCCYTYQRMTPGCRPAGAVADHGKPIDRARNNDVVTWVKLHEEYYRGTPLRNRPQFPSEKYFGKDIFADLEEPAKARGIKVYSRLLEGWRIDQRSNFVKVHQIDIFGRLTARPCYNHPDYINFWLSCVEDLFNTYPYLAGIYWGSENSGPLPHTLSGGMPACFCGHCRGLALEKGVDPRRAVDGYTLLHEMIQRLRGGERPTDGAFVEIMRLFFQYPEIFAWEKLWNESYARLAKLIGSAMKTIKPDAQLGYHADHHVTGLNVFKRIGHDYREMVTYYDWIKPCVYRTCTGPRLNGNIDSMNKSLFADLSKPQLLDLHYALMGYNPADHPNAANLASDDLKKTMMGVDYTRREIKRCVDAVGGRAKVYTGVGPGIPVWDRPAPEDPQDTFDDCIAGFEAGAGGVLISREYDENEMVNLKAVGKAVRQWSK